MIESADQFTIIGENIHTTRVVKRNGIRATTLEDGTEAVKYRDSDGQIRHVTVPEHFTHTQPYEQGMLKHFMIAVWKGLHGDAGESAEGTAYIHNEVARQINAGAGYLDLNVDEASYKLDEQKASMEWLVNATQAVSSVPLSIDSSNEEIIETGLVAYNGSAGRPILNSASLERINALDLAIEHNARVVVTAAREDGMPENAEERTENVGKILEAAFSKEMAPDDIFIDPLIFPISVSGEYGPHAFGAIRQIRERFGGEVHITGGMSNVSFGLPKRKLVNDVFLRIAIENGADSGIIDPIQSKIPAIMEMDMDSKAVKITVDMLMGNDEYCMNFLKAFRAGELD